MSTMERERKLCDRVAASEAREEGPPRSKLSLRDGVHSTPYPVIGEISFMPPTMATTRRWKGPQFRLPSTRHLVAQREGREARAGASRLNLPVRLRLREIYRSFVLGNYLAAIALSRAVLEQSLIECSQTIDIEVSTRDPRHPGRTKRLEDLVDAAGERLPHLRVPMESIRENGNKVLHPKRSDDLAPFALALRKVALESLRDIRSEVEELYLDPDRR